MNFIKKTYVWSVCLEPMLYLLWMNYIYGANLGVSRTLQIVVLFSLLSRFLINGFRIKSFNIFDPMYKYYSYFMFFSVFSALFGIIYGAYTLPSIPVNETMFMSVYRPLAEYIINIYYFGYFVILARFMLTDSHIIDYFFKVFTAIFYFSLIIGLLDLVAIMYLDDYAGIHRQIRGSVGVGFRFHGFAGEPRDAFVYLWLGIGILYLKDIWRNETKLTKKTLFVIFIAMVMTQSASGVFGLIFSCGLLIVYFLHRISFPKKILTIFLIFLLPFGILIILNTSGRLRNYGKGFLTLYDNLHNGNVIYGNILQSMTNIYPVWDRWLEVMNLNILPLLIGTGLGTSSVINNFYIIEYINLVLNPNSNIVRMVYDVGIIGSLLLIKSFIYPIDRLNINKDMSLKLLLCMLLILGAYFGHRSVAPFLFLGVMIMAIENKFPVSLNKD
jgi:hypothetical protein